MSTRAPYSNGCHACRRMKVKCDERKPRCGRCTKARRVCPGYRDVNQVIFRSMNVGHASKAKASCLSQKRTVSDITVSDHVGGIELTPFASRLLIQPSESWDSKAISHFLHNYAFAPTRDNPGYLGFLPDLLGKSPRTWYLESAVLAAGSASLANITGLEYLERTAKKYYGETLLSISGALKDPLGASSDAALSAILVIQMYEAIAGITSVSRDPHDKGLIQLSRLRGNVQPSTDNGNALLRIIHSRLHNNAIGGLSPSPIGAEYDAEAVNVPTHQTELCRLMRETSQCCAEIQAMVLVSSKVVVKSEIIKSLDNLFSVYRCLIAWWAAAHSRHSYQSYKTPSRRDCDLRPDTFPVKYHIFKSLHQGGVWISFWCTLIHALQILVYASSLPALKQIFNEGQQSWNLREQLCNTVDEICACVPYMMSDVDQSGLPTVGKDCKALGAYMLSRGLYVASCVAECNNVQREYMTKTFLRIAHGRGIKLALRPINRWLNQHQESATQYHRI
ncbi:hypothetical protein F4678DRAFT_420282 [Xylaria arbuscula]|nr:hypothetical protein F4678DRAFT_420282 [Xylaria arbuscula]